MEGAVVFGGDEPGYFAGEVFGVGGGEHLVIDHGEFRALFCQPYHGLDEVAAFATGAGGAEEGGDTDDEVLVAEVADELFAGELGLTVDIGWDRCVELGVGGGAGFCFAAEDIVGAYVDELSADLLRHHSDVSGADCVYQKSLVRVGLAVIDAVKGGGIDDDVSMAFVENLFYRIEISYLDVGMGEGYQTFGVDFLTEVVP